MRSSLSCPFGEWLFIECLRATLLLPAGRREGEVIDMSRGGMAITVADAMEAGTAVQVLLPGDSQPIGARVVRQSGGRTALALSQESSALTRIDAACRTRCRPAPTTPMKRLSR